VPVVVHAAAVTAPVIPGLGSAVVPAFSAQFAGAVINFGLLIVHFEQFGVNENVLDDVVVVPFAIDHAKIQECD
jgi:hypothetical protein